MVQPAGLPWAAVELPGPGSTGHRPWHGAGHGASLEKAGVWSSWLSAVGSLASCLERHLSGIPMEKPASVHSLGFLDSRFGGL